MSQSHDMEPDNKPDRGDADMHPAARALFGWVSSPRIGSIFFWGLAALTAALCVIDFLMPDRHEYIHAAEAKVFYAVYGFAAFTFVVLMGWPLGRLLRRSENYYNDQDDENGDGER